MRSDEPTLAVADQRAYSVVLVRMIKHRRIVIYFRRPASMSSGDGSAAAVPTTGRTAAYAASMGRTRRKSHRGGMALLMMVEW